MSDPRHIDLDAPPDPGTEARLQSGDCVVSIWLPAGAGDVGRAMSALAQAGFDIAWRGEERQLTLTEDNDGR